MTELFLMNGAVVVLLWGLLWRTNAQRLDGIQNAITQKVNQEVCSVRHQELREDIREIKKNIEKIFGLLEEVRMRLAREDGRQSRS